MTYDTVRNEYFDWLCGLISECFHVYRYNRLLEHLFGMDFVYILEMDGNRLEDGIELRSRFAYEKEYDESLVCEYLEHRRCTVLEMLIALALRCEEHIMGDSELGDRTGLWFGKMIENLELDKASDDDFSEYYVDDIIERFLTRQYEPNGRGGLFTIENCPRDLRQVEIWYQLCWYLNTIN